MQLQGVDQAQFNTIAFETRAWDVFLAALNLDVPSLAVPFVSGAQPPDGVNFSAVANPEYERPRRRGERPHRCGGLRGVERRRGGALRPDEHPAVRRHARRRTFGNGAEFDVGRLGIIANSLRLVEA